MKSVKSIYNSKVLPPYIKLYDYKLKSICSQYNKNIPNLKTPM